MIFDLHLRQSTVVCHIDIENTVAFGLMNILISRYQTRYLDKVSALPAGCYNEITVEASNLIKVPIRFLCLKHWSIHGIAFID